MANVRLFPHEIFNKIDTLESVSQYVGNIDQKEPKKGKSNRACNVNKVITKQFSESAMKKCLKLLTEMLGGQNCFSIQNGFRKISFITTT